MNVHFNDKKIAIYGINEIKDNPLCNTVHGSANEPHKHLFFELSFMTAGKSNQYYANKCRQMVRGDAVICRPDDIHSIEILTHYNYQHIDLYVFPEKMKRICDNLSSDLYASLLKESGPIFFRIPEIQLNALENTCYMFKHKVGHPERLEAYHTTVVHTFLGQFIALGLANQDYPTWLNDFILQLYNIGNLVKPIGKLVTLTYVSHSYLCREFKKYVGCTLKRYVSKQKINYSLELLSHKNVSILEIASTLGYDSQNNYVLNFKKEFGLTPMQWRKKFRD